MEHIDLFSGIGGFSLAADRVWKNVKHTFCDNDPFCQAVLRKHWPTSKIYGDIKWLASATEAWYNPGNLCQYHALIARKNPRRPIPIEEGNVSQKHNTTDYTEVLKDERSTTSELEKQQHDCVNWLLIRMEASADAAEKKNPPSSPSTIPTEEEQGKEKICSVCNFIENSVIADSQTDIESSAITAIMELTDSVYAHTRNVDLITGGFPCQGFSQAGKRRGTADARWLWPEMYRIIRATSPRFVVAENVRGFLNWEGGMAFKQVLSDLENGGYEIIPVILPACSVGAPHRRDRVWIIAHLGSNAKCLFGRGSTKNWGMERHIFSQGERQEVANETHGSGGDASDTNEPRRKDSGSTRNRGDGFAEPSWNEDWPTVATRLCSLDDELPDGLVRPDGSRDATKKPRPKGWRNAALKAAGNAIVPDIAEQIFRAIRATDVEDAN